MLLISLLSYPVLIEMLLASCPFNDFVAHFTSTFPKPTILNNWPTNFLSQKLAHKLPCEACQDHSGHLFSLIRRFWSMSKCSAKNSRKFVGQLLRITGLRDFELPWSMYWCMHVPYTWLSISQFSNSISYKPPIKHSQ